MGTIIIHLCPLLGGLLVHNLFRVTTYKFVVPAIKFRKCFFFFFLFFFLEVLDAEALLEKFGS